MSTGSPKPPLPSFAAAAAPRLDGWLRQAVLYLGAYLAYGGSRWLLMGDQPAALANAEWIVELERTLGLAIEAPVQRALDGTAAMWLLNHAYVAAQVIVLPIVLVGLYRRAQPAYLRLRDTVLATWLLALPLFWLFPVAPPRLAGVGIADTISGQTGLALDSTLTTSFYNPLAAVPSLHCGFALAVSCTLASAAQRPAARALALAWAPLVFLAVVATGNHFVFDIAAGVAVTGAGLGVAALAARRRTRAEAA